MDFEERTNLLIGEENTAKLHKTAVAVFGLGGVGGYVAEALARAGVGTLILVDNDTISESNINRQIVALHSTVGQLKTEAFRSRLKDINPDLNIYTYEEFILPNNCNSFFDALPLKPDYAADCIDTVSGKIAIIEECKNRGIEVITSMGTGNKTDPLMFKICDISKTKVCPLARVMRKELKDRGIEHVKALYSEEAPIQKGDTVASISFVPSVAGLLIAREIIIDTCELR